ncbi:DUF1524 domain-containing protein [Agromyces tardus]|uniref:DUF1524 domain-containing protein n=1 Tax=Agromyces tardus TaxID=2583849 RepID=A0A3M8A6B4_9MICO|nr:cell wall-binding repeat-containing protein [Agromyces tardus]RNB46541.1 DUF1524 domain-containing protein [Agromyces tardus]
MAAPLLVAALVTAPIAANAVAPGETTTPAALLAELIVATPSSVTYNRDLFAEGIDADGDGCNTRREVLQAESLVPVTIAAGCDITAGEWFSWYEGVTQTDPALLEMDHLVALKEAWISGAWAWTDQQRSDYANDLDVDETLTVVTGAENTAKSAYDPAQWIPSYTPSRCEYASDWVVVKYRWNLTIDTAEKSALQSLISDYCGASTVVVPPVRTDTVPSAPSEGSVNPLPAGTYRLAGADRYATAVAVSARFNPGVPVVYVAAGTNYPDALSASALAGAKSSPLLLVQPTAIPSVVLNEIKRLAPQKIVIAGGVGAVSAGVAAALSAIAPVERAAGADRYETSRILAQTAGLPSSGIAYVATGRAFPDALSASGAAGTINAPVLLVDGLATSANASTVGTLNNLGTSTVRIAGGTGVVTTSYENSLKSKYPTVQRYAGADRYATGVAVNQSVFSSASTVYLAVGTGFADALAGGALAGATSSPLFIVTGTCIPPVVKNQITALNPSTVVLLGGTGSLSNAVASLTECATSTPPPGPTTPANPGDTKNCSDFSTWSAAQSWFNYYYPYYGDIAKLDFDNDKIACESLPGAP